MGLLYREQTWSNPQKIYNRLSENLIESKNDVYSCQTVIDAIIEYITESSEENYQFIKIVQASMAEFCSSKSYTTINGLDHLNAFCNELNDYMSKLDSDMFPLIQVTKLIEIMKLTYDNKFDELCLIVDRDRQSFKENQYEIVKMKYEEQGYKLYVTNPLFEFWLLLHFEAVNKLDKEKLHTNRKYPQDNSAHKYIDYHLNMWLKEAGCSEYEKSDYDVDYIISHIDIALSNAQNYCSDLTELKNSLGTNLADLINELRSK